MEQVKALLAGLRVNYLKDLPSHIDDIEHFLLQLERDGFQLDLCRELYRQVHSLKGSGGTFGLDFLTDICHPFEDVLSSLIEQPNLMQQGIIGNALRYVDLMRKTCSIYLGGQEPGQDLKLSLHALRKRVSKNSHSALIIEGSEVVASMLKETLSEYGCRVEMVRDGYLALGRILAEPFDLLVTGLENKRLNGLALISAVQNSGVRVAKTKTILLTATSIVENQIQPDYILKKNADMKLQFRAVLAELFHTKS
jgi:chemotaxis protein histidine kinase CheA